MVTTDNGVLSYPPGRQLDLAVDKIVFDLTGRVPSRPWSQDAGAADALFDAAVESLDWCFGFNIGEGGYVVHDPHLKLMAASSNPTLAKIRAVIAHCLRYPDGKIIFGGPPSKVKTKRSQ